MTNSAISTSQPSLAHERPLNAAGRLALTVGATAAILSFYLGAALSLIVLGALVAAIAVLAVTGARVGLGRVIARLGAVPSRLIGVLARKLWLSSGPRFRLALDPSDAPGLFSMVRDLGARVGVASPRRIYLEMNAGAWVELRGFLPGTGHTVLGIGYDLLAGLTRRQVEAVLAHELAHAKLVHRGVHRWLNKGLGRLTSSASALSAYATTLRQEKNPSALANAFEGSCRDLALIAARLVATYSRQDEFAADRLAAEVCGASVFCSALVSIERLQESASWLPWTERLARVQPGQRFSTWLVDELARGGARGEHPTAQAIDHFSTHPSTHDRIAALAPGELPPEAGPPALALLAHPDDVAERLCAEIERVAAAEEERDSRRAAREARKWTRATGKGARYVATVIAIAIGIVMLIAGLTAGFTTGVAMWTAGLLSLGALIQRYPRFRRRLELPVPTYGSLTYTRTWDSVEALAADENEIEKEIIAATRGSPKRQYHRRLTMGSEALAKSDYLRAHVASRLALQIEENSMDAAIVHAIATAAMGQAESTHRMLRIIRSHEGFPTTSARWGAAWALGLLDDPAAEGLLLLVLDERPHVATFAALLAYIQSRRGKTRSALENARKASALEPENGAITWLVVHLLLSLGNVHDAARSAEPLRAEARTDLPLAFLFLRLALLERDDAAGREWAQVIRGLGNNGEELLALAGEFATARIESDAAELYGAAAEAGFTPEANIGLAALATFRGDREAARRHLLAALQFDRARLSKNANASDLFHQILARLGALREERVACRAWIASFPSDGSVLAERSLLVCAANEAQARDHLYHVVSAMSGDERAFDLSRVVWRDAPADDQPIRPIQPGVKAIVS